MSKKFIIKVERVQHVHEITYVEITAKDAEEAKDIVREGEEDLIGWETDGAKDCTDYRYTRIYDK